MQLWFLYLIVSTCVGSVADFLAKVLFRKHHGLTVGGYLVSTWLIEIIILYIFVLGWKGDTAFVLYQTGLFWAILGITCVLRFGVNLLYYTGMKRLDASIVTVLFTFSTVVSVIVGILFHGESIGWLKIMGVLLTIGAIILVYSHISWKNKKTLFFWCVLGSALLYGIQMNIEKVVGLSFDPFVFRLWYSMLSVLGLLLFYKDDISHDVKYICHRSFWVLTTVSALLFSLMNITLYYSFSAGAEAGKIDAINNVGIFIIIALEFFVFREKYRWQVKLLAAVLSCVGVWLLY